MLMVLLVCVPASRLIAALVERKRNTFTVAGAAFVATIILPWLVIGARPWIAGVTRSVISPLPIFAAVAIGYVLGESIGRLACLSFGCCYGIPLRDANPEIARLFQKHNLVIHGPTKKAAYASGLAGEPLIPVQAITSAIFAIAGLAGIALFLAGQFRLAAIVPLCASWGWRACSEWLRADYRGTSRISAYQAMAAFSLVYLSAFLVFPWPSSTAAPDLAGAFAQLSSAPMLLAMQAFWIALFVYYGRSRVTESKLSFHVIAGRI
jgi:prolipoprotein diacylglyceryltransferase